jgi:alpha-methylacyl-CoA racemase
MGLGMMGTGLWRDERGVNLLDSGAPFYDVYETSDGRYMAVGPLEEPFYAEMLRLLGLENAPSRFDDGQAENLRALLARTFCTRTRAEWTEVFEGTDACVSPVLSYGEAPAHPQLAARATYVEHHGVTQPAPAPRFSRTGARLDKRPARLGEHTREVLEEWGVANVSELIESGAAVQRE